MRSRERHLNARVMRGSDANGIVFVDPVILSLSFVRKEPTLRIHSRARLNFHFGTAWSQAARIAVLHTLGSKEPAQPTWSIYSYGIHPIDNTNCGRTIGVGRSESVLIDPAENQRVVRLADGEGEHSIASAGYLTPIIS